MQCPERRFKKNEQRELQLNPMFCYCVKYKAPIEILLADLRRLIQGRLVQIFLCDEIKNFIENILRINSENIWFLLILLCS